MSYRKMANDKTDFTNPIMEIAMIMRFMYAAIVAIFRLKAEQQQGCSSFSASSVASFFDAFFKVGAASTFCVEDSMPGLNMSSVISRFLSLSTGFLARQQEDFQKN